jgi:starch synthase
VVHATGGLRDTVPPCDENGQGGLGFTFQSYNADDFMEAVKRAIHLYRDNREGFRGLQHTEMCQDFSWNKGAARYMELFQRMLSW